MLYRCRNLKGLNKSLNCLICPDQFQEGAHLIQVNQRSGMLEWQSFLRACGARINIYKADDEVLSGFMSHYHIHAGGVLVAPCTQRSVKAEPTFKVWSLNIQCINNRLYKDGRPSSTSPKYPEMKPKYRSIGAVPTGDRPVTHHVADENSHQQV